MGLEGSPGLGPSCRDLSSLGEANALAHQGRAFSVLLRCWTIGLCDPWEVDDPLWAHLPTCKWENWTFGVSGPSGKQPLNPSVPQFPHQPDICRRPSQAYLPPVLGDQTGPSPALRSTDNS